ncbi:hypothetical protein [Actinoallomurus iriomotensis]|uniref:Uncharacterized protein n=1 Tax=Actinoallomurus iriomotensis TaxID=478107 RepID=A0A9W6RXC0_9ACTN|nr:hypothetical protein [Actinoallomurus iriomotensis]GLY81852.1 hypothetical protein Airi01_101190 [Actinoallomurus iriomotensis]
MSVLQFIDSLVGRLAWPIVALALGLVFRRPLSNLIGRLNKLRWGEKEAVLELAGATSEVEEAVKDAAKPLIEGHPENEEERLQSIERLVQEAASLGFRYGTAGVKAMPTIGIQWYDGEPVVTIAGVDAVHMERIMNDTEDMLDRLAEVHGGVYRESLQMLRSMKPKRRPVPPNKRG